MKHRDDAGDDRKRREKRCGRAEPTPATIGELDAALPEKLKNELDGVSHVGDHSRRNRRSTAVLPMGSSSVKLSRKIMRQPRLEPSAIPIGIGVASPRGKPNPSPVAGHIPNIESGHRHVLSGVGKAASIKPIHHSCWTERVLDAPKFIQTAAICHLAR